MLFSGRHAAKCQSEVDLSRCPLAIASTVGWSMVSFFICIRMYDNLQAIEMQDVVHDSRPPSVESVTAGNGKMHRLKPMDMDNNRNNRSWSPSPYRRTHSPQPYYR